MPASSLLPSRADAESWLRAGWAVPVARRWSTELDAPDLFERLRHRPYPFLLESARPHPVTGRYSFLGCDPPFVLRARGPEGAEPLARLRRLLSAVPTRTVPGFPPFVGGAVGVLGYDAGRWFERLPAQAADDMHFPDLVIGLYETVVALDHAAGMTWLLTRAFPGAPRAYDEALARLDTLANLLRQSPIANRQSSSDLRYAIRDVPWVSTHARASFEAMVRQAKSWIADGEIYQANLSQRLQAPFQGDSWGLYRRLRAVNPSPFAGYFDAGDVQLVCGSPERLVRLADGVVETRPIAGTRPCTGIPWQDEQLRAELAAHPKERAEHLMLVDLERNDLGRICRYGSVEVTELMTLEAYSHVVHLVSNVCGRLVPGRDWLDIVAALFPGGTITGCPKIRAIECIDALEPVRRQWYTGSLGYFSFTGAIDLNLIIRSALVAGGQVSVWAGAGIVADSDPTREYEETLQKAEALLVALRGPAEVTADALAV